MADSVTIGLIALCFFSIATVIVVVVFFLSYMKTLKDLMFVDRKSRLVESEARLDSFKQEAQAKLETHTVELANIKENNEMVLAARRAALSVQKENQKESEDPDNVGPSGLARMMPMDWGSKSEPGEQ